jgi:hypothetical protein
MGHRFNANKLMNLIGNSRKKKIMYLPAIRYFRPFPHPKTHQRKTAKTTSFLLAPGMLVIIVIVISATGRVLVAGCRDLVSSSVSG